MQKTKLEQIFNLFQIYDKNRIQYNNPFNQNGNVYQTDFQTLIECPKDKIDFPWSNPEGNKCSDMSMVVPENNMFKKVILNSELIHDCRTEDDYDVIRPRKECEECNGTGLVEWSYDSTTNGNYTDDFDCPECHGRGGCKEITQPNGKKKFPENIYFKIGVCVFSSYMISRLDTISKLLEADVYLISQSESSKASLFNIGYLKILLMPIPYCEHIHFPVEIGLKDETIL